MSRRGTAARGPEWKAELGRPSGPGLSEYFGVLPTSTTEEVRKLTRPDLLVEVEVIAVLD